ncbi:dockerin type I domain-containing protein [Dyadobacter sp. BHUBP1]|uniref:dockerin type I domain-containing protein n=1 Tax=Dyadobacter sp. BHUBP1 TaxID=3424178 RepID=UPI003D3280DD
MNTHLTKAVLLAVLAALPGMINAQIKFTYDNAGNRIKRELNSSLVQLDAKVLLRGAYRPGQANMASDLQTYFSANSGLLPATDPYGGNVVYNNIGNPAGVAGSVVDWIKVEIRDAASPAVKLQSKSLLLKPNGSIVDIDGTLPKFVGQSSAVRIAVFHRNHVAILSNAIASFNSGTVIYDFTTALNKASQLPGDPAQMGLFNGKWYLWAGDVNGDGVVDASDMSIANNDFLKGTYDQYLFTDVNLDGGVDATDGSIMNNAFMNGYYSTLVNYLP